MHNKIFKTDKFEFNIDDVLEIAKKAGEEVLKIYNENFEVEYKDDKSPLTKADKISHQIITNGLNQLTIKTIDSIASIDSIKTIDSIDSIKTIASIFPILSEEGKNIPYEERKNWEYFWMIDPLDGTKEFIKKNGEFTINIALIHKNEPIFGVVYAPVLDWIYFNDNKNSYKIEKAKLIKLPIKRNDNKFIIVASRSHLNEETKNFIENYLKTITSIDSIKTIETISIGSSLKLCLVAEGVADMYPRLAPTMEWDTAAADAIVRKAGKKVYSIDSIDSIKTIDSITYNKENLLNPWFVVK